MASIPDDMQRYHRVVCTLINLEEQIKTKSLSLKQARQRIPDELLFEIEQELERMINAARATVAMTDEDCEEQAWVDEELELAYSKEDLMESREHAKDTLRTLEIGRRLLEIKAVPEVAYLPDPYDRKETETADKANNKVTHGFALAIVAGGKNAEKKVKYWRKNTVNGHPLFPCNQGRDEITVYLEPEGYNAAELWAKVHNLDALTLDVYLAILAFICDPRNKATYPHVGWFTVNPQQIADLKAFRDCRKTLFS